LRWRQFGDALHSIHSLFRRMRISPSHSFRLLLALLALAPAILAQAPAPIYPDREWQASTPEAQGVDGAKLDEAMQYLGNFIHAQEKVSRAVVIRHGHMIWKGSDIATPNCVFSVTKVFASAVLGHLIDRKKCTLETRAKDCVSLDLSAYPDVTLFHLATMTSGYNSAGPTFTKDGVSTPFTPQAPYFKAGTSVDYNDHAAHLLGYVLTRIVTQRRGSLESYFREHIARPIGMVEAQWYWENGWPNCKVDNANPDYADVRSVATGMWISADALARFGYLFLNRGRWKDRQVLSEEWVRRSTSVQVPATLPVYGRYGTSDGAPGRLGLLWWINEEGGLHRTLLWPNAPRGTYAAVGAHHNWCWIIPEWNMVVVRIGEDNPHYLGNFDKRYDTFFLKLAQAVTGGKAR
jgi:CubicO group peptidase (beta-lactamase class C family)